MKHLRLQNQELVIKIDVQSMSFYIFFCLLNIRIEEPI